MLFVANVLELNGGTTFILRLAREFFNRNEKIGVLVLFDIIDKSLEDKIRQYADVFYLKDFSFGFPDAAFRTQLGVFAPIKNAAIENLLRQYNFHVHAMGVFGLLFVKRHLKHAAQSLKISFGIYHQNEIMFAQANYYFANKARAMFSSLPAESVVFFNEFTRLSHERFFCRDYSGSTIVPIGIDFPSELIGVLGRSTSNRIVSIGNLHDFKSYNRHVINMMPSLKKIRPGLAYEIYGVGSYKSNLANLVKSLHLEDSVLFKGAIAYDDIPKVLDGALAFVGSGTAILEASALGIPSIIGIESTNDPITYGFLSDIQGYSYNELSVSRSVCSIEDKLRVLIEDSFAWDSIAQSCKIKAESFSVVHTADGFLRLEEMNIDIHKFDKESYNNFIGFLSFLACGLKHYLGVDKSFVNRRNQGTLA